MPLHVHLLARNGTRKSKGDSTRSDPSANLSPNTAAHPKPIMWMIGAGGIKMMRGKSSPRACRRQAPSAAMHHPPNDACVRRQGCRKCSSTWRALPRSTEVWRRGGGTWNSASKYPFLPAVLASHLFCLTGGQIKMPAARAWRRGWSKRGRHEASWPPSLTTPSFAVAGRVYRSVPPQGPGRLGGPQE